jgi:hypothetical protein
MEIGALYTVSPNFFRPVKQDKIFRLSHNKEACPHYRTGFFIKQAHLFTIHFSLFTSHVSRLTIHDSPPIPDFTSKNNSGSSSV